MKRTIILLILVIASLFCACNNQNIKAESLKIGNAVTETAETQPSANTDISPSALIEAQGSDLPIVFNNEEELKAVIKGEKTLEHGQGNPDYVTSIAFYFVPDCIPDKTTLSQITVSAANIAFLYPFDEKADPNLENAFVFEWFRQLGPGDMEKNVMRWYSENQIERYEGYMIHKVKPYDKSDTREYMRQDVFWEQDGYAFHAVLPITFTKDDITKYCAEKKVVVK